MFNRLLASRQLHTTCLRQAGKVKKAVADLPKTYILPDGKPATPLSAFSDSPTPKSRSRKKAVEVSMEALPHTDPAGPESSTTEEPPAASFVPKTQLAQEIHDNLAHFPHCILLTRVGQFYESYFDQANEVAHLLNIKLTSRKWNGGRVPMCGFPLLHLDKHLKTLVQDHNRFVAMCEEFTKFGEFGEKSFERRVTRIVTPGTLIDEPFLNTFENNYLLAIQTSNEENWVGLAWTDVSTGEFFSKTTTLETLQDDLARIGPREVVLPSDLAKDPSGSIPLLLKEERIFYNPTIPVSTETLTSTEDAAIRLLSEYLRTNLLENAPSLDSPSHEADTSRMQIDAHTIKSLEIKETSYEGAIKGSLVSVIRRTTTDSGSRLLARRLCRPSTSLSEVEGWQATVAFFLSRHHLRADLIEKLKEAGDIGRIVQRFTLKRGDISDLLSVKKTIDVWGDIIRTLELEHTLEFSKKKKRAAEAEWAQIELLRQRIRNLEKLSARIGEAIDDAGDAQTSIEEEEEQAAQQESGVPSEAAFKWVIKPGFSPTLTSLHTGLTKLFQLKDDLEKGLRLEYNAPSLTLRASSAQGMHVHIGRARRDCKKLDSDPLFTKISESASTKAYFYRQWAEIGGLLATTSTALAQAERQSFEILREEVVSNASLLRNNAAVFDEIDVAIGFASLAEELNFVRPTLTEERSYHVLNGRHPSVELGLLTSGRTFTPNTISMSPTSSTHIITGPNMAGKSTALRQTALIAVLAQVGSFVPADEARLGLVDKLFTRIGAKDDLFRDRSTFMVEMLETADILRRATPRSLVIMDEVGRGTTVKDGLSIAFAAVHHLVTVNQSRCLFATHFHELSDMIGCSPTFEGKGVFSNVRFFCTDVDEISDTQFAYSYRLRPGVNRDSHGLKVASLAGLPPSALEVATKTLSWLKAQDQDKQTLPELNDNSELSSISSTAS